MNTWYLEFQYNEKGRGDLVLMEGNLISMILNVRTGSIDNSGKLVNAIKKGIWSIRNKSVITNEKGMVAINGIPARKIRLYTPMGNYSRYLIHPDGGLPGSNGCIVFGKEYGNMSEFFIRTDRILNKQKEIKVFINTPVPMEVKNGIT